MIKVAIFLLLAIFSVRADIPVHCLKHQIVGDWSFDMSKSKPFNKVEGAHQCGHDLPDNADTSNHEMHFDTDQTVLVTLNHDDSVSQDDSNNGHWTMIYDEGFSVRLFKTDFTAFSKYFKDGEKMKSDCSQTLTGWYHDYELNTMGCFKGKKTDGSKQINNENQHGTFVQPKDTQTELVQTETKRNFLTEEPLQRATHANLHKGFKDHQETVEKLNNGGNSWTAKFHDQHQGMSLLELNQRAGHSHRTNSFKNSFIQGKSESKGKNYPGAYPGAFEIDDVADLPKQFSWVDELAPVQSQGDCGSCYIFATLQMLQARLKIHYDDDTQLSVQHVVDCNVYNQGCDGGYPYLVEKFGTEYDLVPEDCNKYQGRNTGYCERCDVKKLDKTYQVESYDFVGGAYGRSSERNMMVEIQKNGPITASFEPGYDFMFYNNGVYHSGSMEEWVREGEMRPEWEQVDHSVLLYGWGETETGEKYWNLQNTWGEGWGEEGHFRMRRGVDDSAIESLAEAAMPIVVQNKHKNSYVLLEENLTESILQSNKMYKH